MPYIPKEKRIAYDREITQLVKVLRDRGWHIGDMNYIITRLIDELWCDKRRYRTNAEIRGMLADVSDEFYRRRTGLYEDKACEEHGDVYKGYC